MKRKLAVVLGIIAIVVLAFGLWAMLDVPRGFHSTPSKPLPTGPAITEARMKAHRDVAQLFRDVEAYCSRPAFTFYDTSTLDYCEVGRNDWRIHSTFNNRCRYYVTKYYGFSGDFRFEMLRLDSALVAWGWTRAGGGLRSMLSQYYDPYYGSDKPKPVNFPHQYIVSNMPSVSYTRGTFRCFIRYEESDPSGRAVSAPFEVVPAPWELSHQEARIVDTRALFPTILEKNRYVLVIGIMAEDYFVN
jgi:hypothetical protein